jgi:hypothetical protein
MKIKVVKVAIFILLFANAKSQPFFNVGGGTNNGIYILFADTISNTLYAGGLFSQAGNTQSKCIAKWDGLSWDSLQNNLSGDIRGINMLNNYLYVDGLGGTFDSAASQWVGGPLKWNSLNSSWVALSPTLNHGFRNIINYNNSLYFLGDFDSLGGIYSSKIIRYDGTNWYPFPPLDTNGGGWTTLNAMFYNGDLYVRFSKMEWYTMVAGW